MDPKKWFDLSGKVAAVTGGGGVLAGEMARALAQQGVRVAVLDLREEAAGEVATQITAEGGHAIGIKADVLDRESLENAARNIVTTFGGLDILLNGAGGNRKDATTSEDLTFFDLPPEAIRFVADLNLLGTILPSQVMGKCLVERGAGSIVNISSMNSFRPLTRIIGYSAAKAAVNNFTQWLAVHIAQNHSPRIRVNALAPGFFETEQNRFLLRDETSGALTERGASIIAHTPMGRFGHPGDLLGALTWLVSPASEFVTGIVVPVDGGFSAYSGV